MKAPVIDIPAKLDIETERARQKNLDRLTDGVIRFASDVGRTYSPRPDATAPVTTGTTSAAYDVITRVAPAQSDTVVTVQLPQPQTADGGRPLIVARTNYNGAIILKPLGGATLNGLSRLMMFGTPGIARIMFDGQNFYTDYQGALAWDEGL